MLLYVASLGKRGVILILRLEYSIIPEAAMIVGLSIFYLFYHIISYHTMIITFESNNNVRWNSSDTENVDRI